MIRLCFFGRESYLSCTDMDEGPIELHDPGRLCSCPRRRCKSRRCNGCIARRCQQYWLFTSRLRLPTGCSRARWLLGTADDANAQLPSGLGSKLDRHRQHDPYLHAAYCGSEIVDWDEVQRNAHQLTSKERDSLNYIADAGFQFGLTVPLHMSGNRFAFITACGGKGGRGWAHEVARSKNALFLIPHYFNNMMMANFEHHCSLSQGELGSKNDLSTRELECLSWCAQGKTIEETSSILGLSMGTVRVYLKRAKSKLNAVSGAHAVAKATYLRLFAQHHRFFADGKSRIMVSGQPDRRDR